MAERRRATSLRRLFMFMQEAPVDFDQLLNVFTVVGVVIIVTAALGAVALEWRRTRRP